MASKELAMHEKLEVHEILIFKTACVAKSKMFADLVKDDELKKILEEDLEQSTQAIKDLRKILKNSAN